MAQESGQNENLPDVLARVESAMGDEAPTELAAMYHDIAETSGPSMISRAVSRALRAVVGSSLYSAIPSDRVLCQYNKPWHNYGRNQQEVRVARMYYVRNAPVVDWTSGLENLVAIIREAEADGRSLRPVGAAWSFSPVARTPDYMVNTSGLSLLGRQIEAQQLETGLASRFVHVQAGTQVAKVLGYLSRPPARALRTMGGNAGQTIYGAIATGTHGAFIDAMTIADDVRAMSIVAEGGKCYWLERKSTPLTKPDFDAWGRFTVLRDDQVFDAAVVSVGCFGIVHSVVMEVEPEYHLDFSRTRRDYDEPVRSAIRDLDLSALGIPERPHHFEIVVNPHRLKAGEGGCFVTVCRKTPVGQVLEPAPGTAVRDDILSGLVIQLAKSRPNVVPGLMDTLINLLYPTPRILRGPLSMAFPVSLTDAPTLSAEVAVPQKQAMAAVKVILAEIQAAKPGLYFPGVLGIRFLRKTQAMLGFVQYDRTCTIEFACLGRLPDAEAVIRRAFDALTSAKIFFTPHWGQINWLDKKRVEEAYGADALSRWRAARKVLCPAWRGTFANAFTNACGLTSL